MSVELSVGTTIGISTSLPATEAIGDYSGLSYTTIGEVTEIPEFGGSAEVAEHIPLATGVVNKRAGSINYGESSVSLARLSDDGQAAVKAGFDGVNRGQVHSFKIDNPNIGTIYFQGIVSSDMVNVGDANTFFSGSFTVNITTKLVSSNDAAFHVLTYTAGANGQIIGSTQQYVANAGNGQYVYAVPNSGYVFNEWSDETSDNPRQDTNVTDDISVTASFVPD